MQKLLITTKTKQTKNDYLKRSILLQRKALNDITMLFGKPPAKDIAIVKIDNKSFETLNVKSTAEFACAFWAKTITKATWRYYRSSLIYYAEVLHKNNSLSSEDLYFIIKLLRSTLASDFTYNRTSTQKKKFIKTEDLDVLTKAIDHSRSKYAKTLKAWIHANCVVGLRPCEWKETSIINQKGKISLLVVNAKTTNGRSHGNTRIIALNHLPKDIRSLIINFSSHMNKLSKKDKFTDVYNGCRRLLKDLNKTLWVKRKKNITLYSSRHQFSADLKKSGAGLIDIAYLMGHYSTDTATSHYGKKRYGNSIVKPHVDKELTIGIANKFKPFKFTQSPTIKPST